MGELKHGFGAAKMNKDADERTIPNGEYKDALNIQVVTSDGSDVGTMQTLLGNSKIDPHYLFTASLSSSAKCVGSVADEKNNKIYYFVKDSSNYTDYIFEYIVGASNSLKPVAVDKYKVNVTCSIATTNPNVTQPSRSFIISDLNNSSNITNVRPGMNVLGVFSLALNVTYADQLKVIKMKRHIDASGTATPNWEVFMDVFSDSISSSVSLNAAAGLDLELISDRALNFTDLITGINIIDGTIYWTDGNTEPKKININNLETHVSGLHHTKFLVKDNNDVLILDDQPNVIDFRENPDYLKEEHITVIKKSPLHPPTLLFSKTSDFRFDNGAASLLTSSITTNFIEANGDALEIGDVKNVEFNSTPDYRVGDKLLLRRFDDFALVLDFTTYEVVVEILEFTTLATTANAKIKIAFIANDIPGHTYVVPSSTIFFSMLQQEKPLYEFKFPRFAFRYKYQDEQYSAYSPFSEPAFLPGQFNYKPKDGYNLGMVNTLRSLYVMDFLPDQDTLPKDVVAVDIVYKESNSNNVYIVQTIEYGDEEWVARGSDINTAAGNDARTKGALLITSEMVKAAIASNQLLRPWDNVPRTAKAQDMVGNRIVYANYKQNYNLN